MTPLYFPTSWLTCLRVPLLARLCNPPALRGFHVSWHYCAPLGCAGALQFAGTFLQLW